MSFATRSFEEKRDFIRMKVNCDATITTNDGSTKQGHCFNLSGGGALLELDQQLSPDDDIEVTIHSQYGHAPVFSAAGKVVRSYASSAPNKYRVAVHYQ